MVHLFATPAPRSSFMLSPPPLLKRKRIPSSSSPEFDDETTLPSLDSSLFLPIFSNNDIAISTPPNKHNLSSSSSLPSFVLKPRVEKRHFADITTPKKKRKTMSRTSTYSNNENNDAVVGIEGLEPKGLSFDDALMVEEITARQRRTSLSLIEPVLVKEHRRAQRRSSSAGCA